MRFRRRSELVPRVSEVRTLACRVCVGPSVGWIDAVLAGAPETRPDSDICLSGGPRVPRFLAGHVNLILANFGTQKIDLPKAVVWAESLNLQTADSRTVLSLGREFPPEFSEVVQGGRQTLLATESFFFRHCSFICAICCDGAARVASAELVSLAGGPNRWFVFRQ